MKAARRIRAPADSDISIWETTEETIRNRVSHVSCQIPTRGVTTREGESIDCNRKQPRDQAVADSAVTILGLFYGGILDPWRLSEDYKSPRRLAPSTGMPRIQF